MISCFGHILRWCGPVSNTMYFLPLEVKEASYAPRNLDTAACSTTSCSVSPVQLQGLIRGP